MHINNQKLSFNIFTVGNVQYIFMEHDFVPYNVLLAIATNIPQQFKICAPGTHFKNARGKSVYGSSRWPKHA